MTKRIAGDGDGRDTIIADLEQAQQRISALEAENAALRAERDEALQHRNEAVDLCAATMAQRDRAREELRVRMSAAKDELRAERDERLGATAVARKYRDELAAARQSRARLVRLVRELHSRHAQDVSDELVKALTERDAARAWAAAWKRAACYWRTNAYLSIVPGYATRRHSRNRRNIRRNIRAAEAMERG